MYPQRNIHRGRIGEDAAATYLKNHGFSIIERNFKKPQGDIDIIAQEQDVLVFVEVKTRTPSDYGRGEDAITAWQMRALVKSAYYYAHTHPDRPDSLRIDLVSVLLDASENVTSINHYRNISGW